LGLSAFLLATTGDRVVAFYERETTTMSMRRKYGRILDRLTELPPETVTPAMVQSAYGLTDNKMKSLGRSCLTTFDWIWGGYLEAFLFRKRRSCASRRFARRAAKRRAR
jgi:hypothetical protein